MKRLIYLKLAFIILLGATFSSCDDDDPAVCHSIAISSGNDQAGNSGKNLPVPLQVRVTDASGKPAAEVTVRWEIAAGGGSLSTTSSTTNGDGIAETTWTFGQDNGRVKASIENPSGCSNNSVEFKSQQITFALVESSTRVDPIALNSSKNCYEFKYILGFTTNADLKTYGIDIRGEYQYETETTPTSYYTAGILSPDGKSITFSDCFIFAHDAYIEDWFTVKLYNADDYVNGELPEDAVPVITSNKIGPIRTMKPPGSPRFASGTGSTGKRTPSRR
jgi:hypothetical protein